MGRVTQHKWSPENPARFTDRSGSTNGTAAAVSFYRLRAELMRLAQEGRVGLSLESVPDSLNVTTSTYFLSS